MTMELYSAIMNLLILAGALYWMFNGKLIEGLLLLVIIEIRSINLRK